MTTDDKKCVAEKFLDACMVSGNPFDNDGALVHAWAEEINAGFPHAMPDGMKGEGYSFLFKDNSICLICEEFSRIFPPDAEGQEERVQLFLATFETRLSEGLEADSNIELVELQPSDEKPVLNS